MMEETTHSSRLSDLTTQDYFKFFRKEVPNKKMTRSTFFKVIREINKELVNDLTAGRTVKLPYLGRVRIEKYKAAPQFKGMDYNHFNKTGEVVKKYRPYLLECYGATLAWKRNLVTTPWAHDYSFKIARDVWRDKVLSVFKVEGGHRRYIEYI